MRNKADPLLADPNPLDSTCSDDLEATRPVPLELIARLAAQDPTIQLKIGVIDIMAKLQIGDEEIKKTDE
jgi:hypothetical protein